MKLIPDTMEEKLYIAVGVILGLLLSEGFSLHGEGVFTVFGTIGGAIVGGVIAHKSTTDLYTMQKKDKEDERKRKFINELNIFINKKFFQQLISKEYYRDCTPNLVNDLRKYQHELKEIFSRHHNYALNVQLFSHGIALFTAFVGQIEEFEKDKVTLWGTNFMHKDYNEYGEKAETLFASFIKELENITQNVK